VRASLAIVLFAAVLAGCGSRSVTQSDARVNKCVDRFLLRATPNSGSEQQLRHYAKRTYCAPFERNGWVYDDGALTIAAQKWLDNGGTCATASTGKPTQTVPCEPANRDPAGTIDCALLHFVRRAEVVAYVTELQRDGDVHCDDGTPLDALGVP
jgi:hypothetical protein